MNLTDILTLVNAGYTRAEIEQMQNSEPVTEPAAVTEPEPQPVTEPVAVAEPVPAPAQTEQPTHAQDPQLSLNDVMQSIAKLTSAIQANAIAQSALPTTHQIEAQDIMAEIIRPTFQNRGND